MPRVKPLIREDPRRLDIRGEIGAAQAKYNLTIRDLAKRTGINENTLGTRIGRSGDIGSMRLSELWAIRDAITKIARERGEMV